MGSNNDLTTAELTTIERITTDAPTIDDSPSSNAEAIALTYYEYHGRHDDGNSPADNSPADKYAYVFTTEVAV